MCLYCIGKVSICYIKSCGRIWSAHEGTIYAYTKALLGKNCLSSHSCHIVKNYFFLSKTPSCICSMCLHCIGKVSNCSIKSCTRSWSAHEGTIYAYTVELWSLELACFEHQGSLELVRRSRQFPYTFNVKIHPRLEQRWLELSNSKHGPQGDFFM